MGEIYPDDDLNSKQEKFKKSSSILDSYGTNLNKLAIQNKLDPVIGREDEILRIIQILGRRKKNNPVLVGNPGTGKTSVVEGLAIKIVEGNVPPSLLGKTIYTLDLSSIVAGTKYRGQFEEKMKAIIDELISNPDVIIFIDELHTLVGAGSSSGSLDASNIIKPALARGEIRCIGATTFDEFRENIESDGALDRRFQKVIINPSTPEETEIILNNIKNKYSDFHKVNYSNEIISLIVKLADQYVIDREFPDKAIDILDEVGSYKNIQSLKVPKKIKNLETQLSNAEKEKLQAVKDQDYELAAKNRDVCFHLKKQIKKEYSIWNESLANQKHDVTDTDVLSVISKATGIPLEKLGDKENKNLLGLNTFLSKNVIGQEDAVNKISITVQRNRVGIKKRNKPIGNFIFLGSTGVGKTLLAKKIAEYMFNSGENLIRLDMSEYMESHTVSKLIGSPPGYVGHESGGFLTEQVKRKPYSVVLFDEIEKAHPDIFNVLLQILDEGFITDSLGRTIDFRNCLVILTSNTGVRQLEEFGDGIGFKSTDTILQREENEKKILLKALNKKFPPEFLNRIDEIIIFNKLSKENVMNILTNECSELADNLFEAGEYGFKISKQAKELVLAQGYDPKYGARPLKRAIEKLIENPIAEMILKGEIKSGNTIKVTVIQDKIKIVVE